MDPAPIVILPWIFIVSNVILIGSLGPQLITQLPCLIPSGPAGGGREPEQSRIPRDGAGSTVLPPALTKGPSATEGTIRINEIRRARTPILPQTGPVAGSIMVSPCLYY